MVAAAKGKEDSSSASRLVVGAIGSESLGDVMDCWPPEWGKIYPQQVVQLSVAINNGKIWAAKAGDRVVGWMTWDDQFAPGGLYVKTVAVHPDFRQKGVLAHLVAHMLDFASTAGFGQVLFDVYEEGPLPLEFLKNIGAQEIGEVDGMFHPSKKSRIYAIRPRGR